MGDLGFDDNLSYLIYDYLLIYHQNLLQLFIFFQKLFLTKLFILSVH